MPLTCKRHRHHHHGRQTSDTTIAPSMELPRSRGSMDLVRDLRRTGASAMAAPGGQDAKLSTLGAGIEAENEATNSGLAKTGEFSTSHEISTDDSHFQEPEEGAHEAAGEEKDLSESNPLMMVSTPRGGQQYVPGFSSPPSFGNQEKAAGMKEHQEAQETHATVADNEGADGHAPFLDSSHFSPVEGTEHDDKLNADDAVTGSTEQTAENDAQQDAEDVEPHEPQTFERVDGGVDPGIPAHDDKLNANDGDTDDAGQAEDNAALRNLEVFEHQSSHTGLFLDFSNEGFEQPEETQPANNLAQELGNFEDTASDIDSRISADGDHLDTDRAITQGTEQASGIAVPVALRLPEEPISLTSEYSPKYVEQLDERAPAVHQDREHQAPDDPISEAVQETNALAAQDCEQIFNNHKPKLVRVYVWVQFLRWLLRLDTQDTPPGTLEVTFCLYGIKIIEWFTGLDSAWIADSEWPTESGDSSFSSSDDNPKPPKPLPPVVGARAILFYPLVCNHELYQRRLIYYHMWVERDNPNFPLANTRTSPAEMYAGIRDTCYIFLVTAVGSIFSLVALLLGCWMVSGVVKNAGWVLPASSQLATDSQTPGICAQLENIRPTWTADGTTAWSAVSQALDFAAMAASMNFSAAYTSNILLTRQRASRSMFASTVLNPWNSIIPAHLAVVEATVSGDDVVDDIYSRVDLARNVIGPFQRGLLGLDSLLAAGENDYVDSGYVAAALHGAREAENIILGGIPDTTNGM